MQIALTAIVAPIVLWAAFGKGRLRQNLAIMRQYRLRHILTSVLLVAAIGAVSYGLIAASPVFEMNPILWVISKLFHAGNGHGQGNLIFSGLNWKWYAVFFLPVLALALPRLAQVEEISYRTGTRNWLDGSLRSLRFGLAHLLMLIPFGASLALSLGGLWFTRQYFKGGTERSTIYHAAMNTVIVAVLFIAILVTW